MGPMRGLASYLDRDSTGLVSDPVEGYPPSAHMGVMTTTKLYYARGALVHGAETSMLGMAPFRHQVDLYVTGASKKGRLRGGGPFRRGGFQSQLTER